MNQHTNIVRIKAIANALKQLNENVVFVGGAVVSLYIDNSIATEIRPTDDIDVVIELANYGDYSKLDERLRNIGFENDISSGVICRYKINGIIVDIMPTDAKVLGFSNKWYADGFVNAIVYELENNEPIKIFSLPYFIASKIEAFKSRGKNDFRYSSDFEDVVYVLENGTNIEQCLNIADKKVRQYLKKEFKSMLGNADFEEGLFAHLEPHHASYNFERIKTLLLKFING